MLKFEHNIDIGKIIRDKINHQTYKISGFNHEEVHLEHITRYKNDKKHDKIITWKQLLYLVKADELQIEGYEYHDYDKLVSVIDVIMVKEEAKFEKTKLEQLHEEEKDKLKQVHEEEVDKTAHIIHHLARKSTKVENIRMKRREKINPEVKKRISERKELEVEVQAEKERNEINREKEYRELIEEIQRDKERNNYEQLIELTKEQIAESNSSTEIEKLNERLELYQELLIENS